MFPSLLSAQYLAAPLSFIIPDDNGPLCSGNDSLKLAQVITARDPGGILIEEHTVGGDRAKDDAPVVEHLPSMHQALGSVSSTARHGEWDGEIP